MIKDFDLHYIGNTARNKENKVVFDAFDPNLEHFKKGDTVQVWEDRNYYEGVIIEGYNNKGHIKVEIGGKKDESSN